MRVYTIVPKDQSDAVMVTVFPGNDVCRMVYATYTTRVERVSRKFMATAFRYWRRRGARIERIVG